MAKTKAQRQSMMKAVQQTATSTTSILILISANKGLQGATRGYKGLQGATIWNKGHKAIRSTGSTLHWMVGPVDKHCQTRMEDEQSKRLLCPFERKIVLARPWDVGALRHVLWGLITHHPSLINQSTNQSKWKNMYIGMNVQNLKELPADDPFVLYRITT